MQLAYKTKKPHSVWGFSSCTPGRTRTGTVLLPMDFKSVAYNSAFYLVCREETPLNRGVFCFCNKVYIDALKVHNGAI